MEMTFPRWLSAAVVGCALLLVVVWRPDGASVDERYALTKRDELNRQLGLARGQLETAVDHLRVLQLRDSVAARSGGKEIPSGTMFIDRQFTPEYRRLFDALADREPRVRSTTGEPMDVAFVVDSGAMPVSQFEPRVAHPVAAVRRRHRGGLAQAYVLPASGAGDRCLVLVRVDVRVVGPYDARRELAASPSLAGPCAYYAAFGRPGPAVDRWLRERGWALGERTAWKRSIPVRDDAFWPSYRPRFYFFEGWTARQELMAPGVRCHSGDLTSCERAVLQPSTHAVATWGGGIISLDRWKPNSAEVGAIEEQMLSEMVRTLGPERFGQFWRSTESPAVAFQAAAGMSLGEWTHALLTRTYGEQHLGPGVEPASVGTGLLLLLVGLGLGVVAARRRVVG